MIIRIEPEEEVKSQLDGIYRLISYASDEIPHIAAGVKGKQTNARDMLDDAMKRVERLRSLLLC